MVQEGEAALDGMRHCDAVALRRKDVARQERAGLQVLGARQRMPGGELSGQALAQVRERVVAVDARTQLGRVELADAPGEREARQMREERILGCVQAGAEERLEIRRRLRLQAAEVRIEAPQEERPPPRLRLARPEAPHFRFLEDVVAAEHLVRAFAGQHHLEAVLAHLPREEKERRGRRTHDRPLGVADDRGKALGDVAALAAQRRMVRAQCVDQSALVGRFVELGRFEFE